MIQKLFLTTIIIVGMFISAIQAQITPNAQQVSVKNYQTPVKKLGTRGSYRVRTSANIDTVKNTDFSLNGQYQFMLSRSKTVNGYKLINPARLASVWKSVTDTLRKEGIALADTKAKLAEQTRTVGSLQTKVSEKEAALNNSTVKADEISLLGFSFTKGNYHMIVWSIITVLAISLLAVIGRSSKNIQEAKHRTQLYDDVFNEYQAYKVKSNEQQRKLARELQDERNIVEELRGRG
ncbi:hypothetical protein [Pedobacter insulae]|uniref:Uncharacterized protein n=1 Tax=Pedobacter insulae TaxID=414048 RepID=A0A1I2W417_9SPHI|nr:hypothetical protein [Pedobacter insulae]SFG96124.1 hypothetical protein SAMN04489864_103450 [Pedobacter insulae]